MLIALKMHRGHNNVSAWTITVECNYRGPDRPRVLMMVDTKKSKID